MFELSRLGYAYGLDDEHIITMLTHFYFNNKKMVGKKRFNAEAWAATVKQAAFKQSVPLACRNRFIEYRDSVLAIETDPAHKDHVKLWVSYFLEQADPEWPSVTKRASELIGVGQDVIRDSFRSLAAAGKVEWKEEKETLMVNDSFYWDRLQPELTEAMTWSGPLELCETDARWHEEMDEENGTVTISCFDIRTGKHSNVTYNHVQSFSNGEGARQYVIDHTGAAVSRLKLESLEALPLGFVECAGWTGVDYKDGNKSNCRLANLVRI